MQLNLIPQVFYDILARVVPGFVSTVAWYLTILGPNQAIRNLTEADQSIPGLGSLTWLVVFSYILGATLEELWSLTFKKLKRRARVKTSSIKECNKLRKCFGKRAIKRKCSGKRAVTLKSQDLPATHVMHDYVRVYLPSEGARLLKLRAEKNLCGTLFTGLCLLPIVNILPYCQYQSLTPDRVFLEIAMVVALVTLWTANSRFQQFYAGGTCTAWLLLCFPAGPLKRKLTGKP